MNLTDQKIELASEMFEGPVIKPESYLLVKWNKVFNRTGWNFVCLKTELFKQTHGLIMGEETAFNDGLRLNRSILEHIEQNFTLILSENWAHISYRFYSNDEQEVAILLEDHNEADAKYVDIVSFSHTCPYFEDSKLITDFLVQANSQVVAPDENPQIYLIRRGHEGYETEPFSFEEFEVNIPLNYGKDFVENVHEPLCEFLKNPKAKKGRLVLFHGDPGTGKTYYIRQLLKEVANYTKAIYIPAYLVDSLADPSFIDFLRQEKNSVLIIEDAENVICTENETDRNTGISNLLQVTEGMLGDALKLKVIATFNVDEQYIDKALKRKGRLFRMHCFGPLSIEDAKAKAVSLGLDPETIIEEMTLAEIYNLEHTTTSGKKKKQKTMGFQ